jgi:hypothetical protein
LDQPFPSGPKLVGMLLLDTQKHAAESIGLKTAITSTVFSGEPLTSVFRNHSEWWRLRDTRQSERQQSQSVF